MIVKESQRFYALIDSHFPTTTTTTTNNNNKFNIKNNINSNHVLLTCSHTGLFFTVFYTIFFKYTLFVIFVQMNSYNNKTKKTTTTIHFISSFLLSTVTLINKILQQQKNLCIFFLLWISSFSNLVLLSCIFFKFVLRRSSTR